MSERQSRREILRKSAYVVPTVITLAVTPSIASSGSREYEYDSLDTREKRDQEWKDHDNSGRGYGLEKPKKKDKD